MPNLSDMLKNQPSELPHNDNGSVSMQTDYRPPNLTEAPNQGLSAPAAAPATPCPSSALDPLALQRLQELDPNGSNKLIERVVAAYMKSLDRMLPELATARQEPLDLNTLRHVSHTLKSSSASLGAMALSERCAVIETLCRSAQTEGIQTQLDGMLSEVSQVRQALLELPPHIS